MQSIEEKKFKTNLILVTIIAELFSSFTLWLIESPIKYSFFIFETILIIVIYVILRNYDLKFNPSRFLMTKFPTGILLDISLIYFSVVIILLNVFQIETVAQLPIVFVSTTFIAGYVLLNICKLTKYFTKLETIVLSIFIGFIFTSASTLALLWFDESLRAILIPILFIFLGIVSFFRHFRKHEVQNFKINSLSKKIDLLAIGVSIIFYVLFFFFIYPEFSLLSGTDISRHYANSIILSRNPDLYTGFSYILFHSFGTSLNTLSSGPSVDYFLTIQIILNLFSPLTVYVFSKRFLEKVDKRIPAISVIFYSVFSNFSFLYYMQLKLQDTGDSFYLILGNLVAEKAYFSNIYFSQNFAWFVPQSLGFMIFIFLLLLLSIRDIPRSRLIPLMSILMLSLFLIHLPQALIFIIFLSCFSFISTSKSLRLNDGLISSMIALTGAIMAHMYIGYVWNIGLRQPDSSLQIIFYISALFPLVVFSFFWRKKILHKLHFLKEIKLSGKSFRFLSIILVTFYLLSFLTWFFNDFESLPYFKIGVVPWFIYPMILGILGLLSLVSIKYLHQILPNGLVFLILFMIPFMLILGQIISFVNINIQETHFWEKRLLIYVFFSAALLASISLIKFVESINRKRKFLSNISIMVLISVIVISGFSSIALQSEYWLLRTSTSTIDKDEFLATTSLKEDFNREKTAFTISPSKASMQALTFAVPIYQYSTPESSFYSKNPDLPLFTLQSQNLSHAFLYMHERDHMLLNNKDSWLYDHYIPLLPISYSNNNVTIYNASRVSYPLAQSDTTLIIPIDHRMSSNDSWLFAYDMLSQNIINYTVMYDTDHNALNSKTILLSYDPSIDGYPTDFIDDFTSPNNWKINSENWDYTNGGLHGNFDKGSGTNILLSPVTAENVTIKTSFKILPSDQKEANYVSIIYDWEDPENFSSARATFYQDKIYLALDTINDGKITEYPTWPGIIIPTSDLDWGSEYLYNMTLSKHGDKVELFLNGSRYLNQQGSGNSGTIGLSVKRVMEVFFDNFYATYQNKLNQRNFLDYLSYASSGGHLIVLNTNGYGKISDLFLNSEDSSTVASNFSTFDYDIGSNVSVLDMTTFKNSLPKDLKTKFQEYPSILILEKSIGSGKVTFLNVYPLISDFNEGKIEGNKVYKILGKLLESINLNKIDFQPLSSRDIQLIFRSIEGHGNIKVETKSMIFPDNFKFMNLVITNTDGKVVIENVSRIDMEGYDSVELNSKNIFLDDGNGLYSKITLDNSIILQFQNNGIVTATLDDKQLLRFENVSQARILNEKPIDVIVRQPTIEIIGNTTIYEPSGTKLYSITRNNAQSLSVLGNVTMSLYMSDWNSYAESIEVEGQTKRVPSLLDTDELSPLSLNFKDSVEMPVLLIPFLLTPFLIACVFLLYNPKK